MLASDDCGSHYSISWLPVVLSFFLTKTELEQGDALSVFQQNMEPLDIKFRIDNDFSNVTHVFSKKRNHPRVLLALIHGKPVINHEFTDAVARACLPEIDKNGAKTCPLEKDFEGNWPDAAKYLPPRIEGSDADRPDEAYVPNERRHEIFDGYTFICYERKRYEDLLPVITGGKGKALLREVVPGETDLDDFIRYVKSVAGEKGLGEFEDGSEGRGVVLVRSLPPNDAWYSWYLNFYNQVALRLDHRPVETRDFLPAILDVDPTQLRRPLEVEPTPREPGMPSRPCDPRALELLTFHSISTPKASTWWCGPGCGDGRRRSARECCRRLCPTAVSISPQGDAAPWPSDQEHIYRFRPS